MIFYLQNSALKKILQGKIAFLGESDKAPKFFADLGLPIPINYNPCDHYIHHIALIPGYDEESYRKMDIICDAFENSKINRKNKKKAKVDFLEN